MRAVVEMKAEGLKWDVGRQIRRGWHGGVETPLTHCVCKSVMMCRGEVYDL